MYPGTFGSNLGLGTGYPDWRFACLSSVPLYDVPENFFNSETTASFHIISNSICTAILPADAVLLPAASLKSLPYIVQCDLNETRLLALSGIDFPPNRMANKTGRKQFHFSALHKI
jgi:hypothetical protein